MKAIMLLSISAPVAGFWVQLARGMWLDALLALCILPVVMLVCVIATSGEDALLPEAVED